MPQKKKTKPQTRPLTISLAQARRASAKKRANKAISVIRNDIKKHTRQKIANIRLSDGINREIWSHFQSLVNLSSFSGFFVVFLDLRPDFFALLGFGFDSRGFLVLRREFQHQVGLD